MAILEARNLNIALPTGDGMVHAARDVSFSVQPGEMFGIAGESGSGKSVLAQAILGLLPTAEVEGEIWFEGKNLLALGSRELQQLRGARIAMISQDPLSCLHPFYTIGSQITEAIHTHRRVGRAVARREAIDVLKRVGITSAAERFDHFPHQFSGGMRQRVMIAMAVVLNPALLIADEPTTALDVTVQAQIIKLLDDMRRELGTAVMMITHDLGLLSSVADHVMVMYAGNRMELGPAQAVLADPAHPYTVGLLASSPSNHEPGSELTPIIGQPPSLLARPDSCTFAPRCARVMPACRSRRPAERVFADGSRSLCWLEAKASALPVTRPAQQVAGRRDAVEHEDAVVRVRDIHLAFSSGGLLRPRQRTEVLKGISLELRRGRTLGIVGESGCGKSTLARVIAGLIPASSGTVEVQGKDISRLNPAEWHELRKTVQVVFQDPFGSLNPRRRVGSIIGDPFRIHRVAHGVARRQRVQALMEKVGLNPEHYNRFPSEFSGGQRQRIGIARALALNPSLIIYDEPVSALDVSIQAQVLNLIRSLQAELGLTYLFISHDLSVVRHVSDEIAVMNAGRIVELGDAEQVYSAPVHPYTQTLLAAARPLPSGASPRVGSEEMREGAT
ncbi:ABC transporter ATP-binding protein [Mesorhizobium loti]|nr:ABC transporter ATP-binding protein [Mesorhizobium loti]PLP58529.1 ABC transporter ATP-binding protein [Mesorhizobium loti]